MTTYKDVKEWRKKNPDKVLEQAKRYRERHPETNQKAKAKYRETHIETIRERDRIAKDKQRKQDPVGQRKRYARWNAKKLTMREQEAGRKRPEKCEICGRQAYRIVFDHCHDCGKFRGWLCDRCNRVLGVVNDDPTLLRRLARHLEKHNGPKKVAKDDRKATKKLVQI